MNLVLALEPDASQSALLTSVVRRKLGATLILVTTPQAAMVAMNQRVPDVLLLSRDVPQAERAKVTAHLRSLSGASGVRTLQIPELADPAAAEQAAFQIRMCLAAAEQDRVRAMTNLLGSKSPESNWTDWNQLPTAPSPGQPASEYGQLQTEVNDHAHSQIERLRREADEHGATELGSARPDEGAADAEAPVPQEKTWYSSWQRFFKTRWHIIVSAIVMTLVAGAAVIWQPPSLSTAARTSSSIVGSAGKAARAAAKEAVEAAPSVTRHAVDAAERVIPHPDPKKTSGATPAASTAAPEDTSSLTGPGFMTAFSRIPMDVYADGKRIGTTEDTPLLLKSGTHQIEFVSARFHYRATADVAIRPGHVTPYTVTLPTAEIQVTTTPGAEVWVEGERIGVAPLSPLQVPIGTREIVVKDATGEGRQVVEVRYGESLQLSLVPRETEGEPPPATPHLAPLMRSR